MSLLYIPGTLSRAPSGSVPMYETIFEDMQLKVHQRMTHLQVSQSKLDLLRGATVDDNDLQFLANYILNGWPMHQTNLPVSNRPFWHLRDELHMTNDMVFVG